jgi:putative addiction module component (TIGR02574 family)
MSAIEHLSPTERLALIEELWDSLDPSDVPVTEAHKAELDRRIAAADSALGMTLEEIVAKLRRG